MRSSPLLATLIALALAAPAQAQMPTGTDWYKAPSINAKWTQASITEPDGTVLHADILRPADLPDTAKLPVILSIGPYFNHAGQEGAADPGYQPTGTAGPSTRFEDFVYEAHLMQRGYAYVMVDLRGFGGSTGCLDWGGPGEQADVKSAVEWAAAQPWSTGSVGMYGKSYDGVTGLIGESLQPKGLKAVVSQEPVYDLYNYLYTNGVRFENSLATPALYDGIAATPGVVGGDAPDYMANSVNDPACLTTNYEPQATDSDHGSAYWKSRNFIAASKGHAIPLILTQGFLENNTKPEGAWDYFNELAGPKRAWFGMWDHIRGNDEAEGDDAKPHPWFDEVMRWYDYYVKGVAESEAPVDKDPAVEVESSDGSWRDETRWPPDDSTPLKVTLNAGSYNDTGTDDGTGEGGSPDTVGQGVWTVSPPLPSAAHYAGVPHVDLQASATAPNATMSVDTYDISKDGKALLLSRSATLVPADGKVSMDLYGNDWDIPAGDRLGIRVSSADAEWWTPTGTQAPVTVSAGTITLPFLKYTRPAGRAQKLPSRLHEWTSGAPFAVDQSVLTTAVSASFPLPAPLTPRPASATPSKPNPTVPVTPAAKKRQRLVVHIARKGRRVTVYGTAPSGYKVVVHLVRGKKAAGTKRTRAKLNAFRVTFRVHRAGRYRARVTAKRLHARSKPLRVR
jgi:predicted acyl esterase